MQVLIKIIFHVQLYKYVHKCVKLVSLNISAVVDAPISHWYEILGVCEIYN